MRLYSKNMVLEKPTMFFIGVTTDKSMVKDVFPEWLQELKKDGELIGVNLPVNCDNADYIDIVSFIKNEPLALGALVTTHKVRLYEATKDLFDKIPEPTNEFKEIGCIFKENNLLCGDITDIYSAESAFNDFLKNDYFAENQSDFCILGSGGAGMALAYRILTNDNPKPKRLIITEINEKRISETNEILKKYDNNNILELHLVEKYADDLVESLKDNSVIVNATGLGKDLPGSPISENVNIPQNSYLWEYNYRWIYEPNFYSIAINQEDKKNLKVFDGWQYFIYGWSQSISRVFHIDNISDYFDEFLKVANNKK